MAQSNIRSIKYPFKSEGKGMPAPAVGINAIKADLIMLLRTPRGSRVMRPDLGNDLHRLVFEDVGPALSSLVRREIATTIANEMPSIEVHGIDVTQIGNGLVANVFYSYQGIEGDTGDVPLPIGG